jgi:hypothetical protein
MESENTPMRATQTPVLPSPPACPPWCTAAHDPDWDDVHYGTPTAEWLAEGHRRCTRRIGSTDVDGSQFDIEAEQYGYFLLGGEDDTGGTRIDTPAVRMCDWTITPSVAEELARHLLKAAAIARGEETPN